MRPSLSPSERLAIEDAVVRGWPALESAHVDGWLLRWSSGGSVRANSVSALRYRGQDLERTLAEVVGWYCARGGTAQIVMTEVSEPPGLDAGLAARGWRRSGDHVTMAKDLAAGARPSPALGIMRHDTPTDDWSRVYLQGLSESRRGAAIRLVEGAPRPRMLFSCVRDGMTIAGGLSVADGALASVQCMGTLPAQRRTGAATAVLGAIEDYAREQGARRLYLQTDADNHAAISAYRRFGFEIASRYHTREAPA